MRQKAVLFLLAAVLCSCAGCAPGGDISKRSIVTAVAVNLEEDGVRVAVEYLTRMGSEEQAYESRDGRGQTFAQALADMEYASGRTLYLDGCKVLLLDGFKTQGELRELLGEVDAHGGIRPLTLVAVSPESRTLLEGKAREEDSAGEEVFTLLTGGELTQQNLKDCLNLLDTPGRGLLLPVVERGEEQVQVAGYLSPGGRALVQSPPETARLLPFAKPGEGRELVYTVTGEGYSADWVLEKNRVKIRPKLENGGVSFVLEAEIEGYLLSSRGEAGQGALLARAQEDICRQMLEEYADVLQKIGRVSGNDLFSMGKQLELKEARAWKNLGESWEEKLPEVGVELRGSVLLRDKKRVSDRG